MELKSNVLTSSDPIEASSAREFSVCQKDASSKTSPVDSDRLFYALLARIETLSLLPVNWNSYDAEPPNSFALKWAKTSLAIARQMNFLPSRIDPSAENGMALSFISAKRYCDIECFNSGEILAVKHESNLDPVVWTLQVSTEGIEAALKTIRDFLHNA